MSDSPSRRRLAELGGPEKALALFAEAKAKAEQLMMPASVK